MLFRKKPEVDVRLKAADAIEQAILQRQYDPDGDGADFMCIALSRWLTKGIIDPGTYKVASNAIYDYIQGEGTMVSYVFENDTPFDTIDRYMWRIFCCNHFWRIIRILRNQPFLDTRHD